MTCYSTRKLFLAFSFFLLALSLLAQAPAGYYSSSKGKSGSALKTALFSIISSHTERSYKQLWTDFKTTDVRADGKIWDMYSNVTNYEPGGSAQGASASGEGDSYNREHSFPKSWFNDATPMYTDLFHLYPTDSYVNNRRSNFPFGETEGGTYQSSGGFSKVGACTTAGYTGTVFEPNDEYKGDFARTYFYMATAYEDKIASWDSPMLSGNKYPAYADWALTMLLRWAANDPVSEKEIARNNAVYSIQGNRNPYIDFPGLEQYVWGTKTSAAFNPDNYDSDDPSTDTDVSAPTFSPSAGVVAAGTEVSIACSTTGAYIYYIVNGGELQVAYAPATVTLNENSVIRAYAMVGEQSSDTVTASYTISSDAPQGSCKFMLIPSEDDLTSGQIVLIVCRGQETAMGTQNNDVRSYVSVAFETDGSLCTEVNATDSPIAFQLGGSEGAWTFLDTQKNVYLALTSNGNKLHYASDATSDNALWKVSISDEGVATITNSAYSDRSIQYNASSPRFACYKSSQQAVSLYGQAFTEGVNQITATPSGSYLVYSLSGTLIRKASTAREALENLPAGIYIANGQKVLVK